jgi:hypothetical protein
MEIKVTNLSKWLAAFCVALILWALFAAHREEQLKAVMDAKNAKDVATIAQLQSSRAASDKAYDAQIATITAVKQQVVTVHDVVVKFKTVAPTIQDAPVEVTQKQADAIALADKNIPNAPSIKAGDICFSQADAKPLFDAQADGQSCKVSLLKSQTDLADEVKIDAAKDDQIKQQDIVIAGGTKWRRFKTALKYVGIGAAIGAGAVAYAKH